MTSMPPLQRIENHFTASIEAKQRTLETMGPRIAQAAELLVDRLRQGGKILVCGNGGSAADAQHFAAELVNRFQCERRPYAAIALTTDTSILTAIANDYDYAQVFSKQVEALGRSGDILLAISTSGNAANVCRAAEVARASGIWTVALSGGQGGQLGGLAHQLLCVTSSTVTARIQEGHGMIVHALCQLIEEQMAD